MKQSLIYTLLLAVCVLIEVSCEKADPVYYQIGNKIASIAARADAPDSGTAYDGTIVEEEDSGTIEFVIPYGITITQLYLSASLPVGAFATPTLTGLKDLSSPFTLTIVAGNGDRRVYTVTAKHPDN
ncbi:MAG: hypothetical protein LBN29_08445 [Mediterranea sp.]|jgi:hypothetical protein|nr:hypothetical protein [Mediterranea sp.]